MVPVLCIVRNTGREARVVQQGCGEPAYFAGNGIEEDFPEILSQDLKLIDA